MTVQCINCGQWSPKTSQSVALVKLGFARCLVNSMSAGHTFSALYKRDCDKFEPAPAEIVEARLKYENRVHHR